MASHHPCTVKFVATQSCLEHCCATINIKRNINRHLFECKSKQRKHSRLKNWQTKTMRTLLKTPSANHNGSDDSALIPLNSMVKLYFLVARWSETIGARVLSQPDSNGGGKWGSVMKNTTSSYPTSSLSRSIATGILLMNQSGTVVASARNLSCFKVCLNYIVFI